MLRGGRRTRGARSVTTWIGDAVLTIAAVLGSICIVLVIAAAVFDIRIVLFSTGSMSPTIPAGSAALVRAIPAEDIRVGDVVTVDREGRLPITHRVVSIAPSAISTSARSIVMRGDANAVDDPTPYDVTEVGLTLASAPGVAPLLAAARTPWVLGAVTLAATALIVAVFWPRRERAPAEGEQTASAAPEPTGSAERDVADTHTIGERRRRRLAQRAGSIVAAAVLGGLTLSTLPQPAHASEQVIRSEVITLVSIESPEMRALSPGSRAIWQVGVSADAPEPGTVALSVTGDGEEMNRLTYRIDACPRRWTGPTCEGSRALQNDPITVDREKRTITRIDDTETAWLRIEVALAVGDGPLREPVTLTLSAEGFGDAVDTDAGVPLPATGGNPPWMIAGAGAVLVAAGASLLRGRRPSAGRT